MSEYIEHDIDGNSVGLVERQTFTFAELPEKMALENPAKKVLDLHYSLCPNMFKINPENLLQTLENLGRTNVVHVSESVKADAKVALDRMLALVS